jgi:hypothetical protein
VGGRLTAGALLVLGSVAGCSRGETTSREASATPKVAPAAASVATAGSAPVIDGSATKPFGVACVEDAECAGAVCFHKRLKGPDAGKERRGSDEPVEREGYCSMRCDDDADCPVPPTKGRCGARGMCKRPD